MHHHPHHYCVHHRDAYDGAYVMVMHEGAMHTVLAR
jgi:hypothetical protein